MGWVHKTLQNATGKQNENSKLTLFVWKSFKFQIKSRVKYLLYFLHMQKMIIWLDFKESHQESFLHAYFKWNKKNHDCEHHIIEAADLDPITKKSPLKQRGTIQLNLTQIGTVAYCTF